MSYVVKLSIMASGTAKNKNVAAETPFTLGDRWRVEIRLPVVRQCDIRRSSILT